MNLTRRNWLKSLAVAPAVGVAVAAIPEKPALSAEQLHHLAQWKAYISEAPLLLLTGGRGSGKSYALQQIAGKHQRRWQKVGICGGGYWMREKWDLGQLDYNGPLPQIVSLDAHRSCGIPSAEILVVDNADMLTNREFDAVICQAYRVKEARNRSRVIIASMPSYRNRNALLESGLFECHHMGSTFDNPHLKYSPEQRAMLTEIDGGKPVAGA